MKIVEKNANNNKWSEKEEKQSAEKYDYDQK